MESLTDGAASVVAPGAQSLPQTEAVRPVPGVTLHAPQTGVQEPLPVPPLPLPREEGSLYAAHGLSAPRGESRPSAQPLVQVGLQEEHKTSSLGRCLRPRSSEMSWSSHHLFRPSLTAESHNLEAFRPGSKLSKICSQCPHHAEAGGFPNSPAPAPLSSDCPACLLKLAFVRLLHFPLTCVILWL